MDEVVGQRDLAKLLGDRLSVVIADLEAHERTDIAKDGILDLFAHLGDVLVRHGQIEAVFPRFGEDRSERVRGEVLEFIDVEVKIRAVFLRYIGAAHGIELKLRNNHRAEQRRVVFADFTFAEITNEDFFIVHGVAQVDHTLGLTDDIANDRGAEELPDFVLDWADRLGALAFVHSFKLVCPEFLDDGIGDLADDATPKVGIREYAGNPQHRGIGILQ